MGLDSYTHLSGLSLTSALGLAIGVKGSEVCVINGDGEWVVPARGADNYAYGMKIESDTFFTGGAAKKSYMVGIFGDRTASYVATGDSNDALLRVSGSNYAANDTNFVFRGLNVSINNRSGGTLGRIDNNVSAQGKSGGTVNNILGLMVTAENYGTVSDMFGGLDVLLKNEAAVATVEYGIRIRNENNSIADAVAAAILVSDTGANTGWDYLLDANGASVVVADIRLCNGETISNTSDGIVAISGVIQQGAVATAALSIGGGTSATKLTTATANKNFLGFWTESTAATGDSRGMYLRHYLGGTITSAGYGDAIRAFCTVTGTNYDYASGIHATMQINAGATVTGSGAGGRFTLAAAAESRTLGGALAVVQLDSDIGANNTLPSRASFIRLAKSGSVDLTNFLDIADDQCLKGSSASGAATDALPVIMPDGSTLYISLIAAS